MATNDKKANQKNDEAHVDIRQSENDLFAQMARGVTPMAPDTPLTPPEKASAANAETLPWEHADAMRERIKRRFPGLTDSDLDELMM